MATPLLSGAVPSVVEPFLKVTDPVGTPPDELTVAVTSPLVPTSMVWLPVARADVVRLAVLPVNVTAPSEVVPDLNVTVPVGLPLVVTVAVNVTASPKLEGFTLEANAVLLVSLLTVCVNAGDVLPVLLASPL